MTTVLVILGGDSFCSGSISQCVGFAGLKVGAAQDDQTVGEFGSPGKENFALGVG